MPRALDKRSNIYILEIRETSPLSLSNVPDPNSSSKRYRPVRLEFRSACLGNAGIFECTLDRYESLSFHLRCEKSVNACSCISSRVLQDSSRYR